MSARKAIKAMGLFGGVQVVTILCSIIRTKLVAVWIGPLGVGLFALFNQALETLSTATNLGMRQSSVRDISQAGEQGLAGHVTRMVSVVRRWSVWLALGGSVITMALAPMLSRVTFGDAGHVWGFVALSAAVLLMAVTNGEYAILQGTGKLRRLASVTVWGTLTGLAVSVPLFYWLRERSIVPSIVAYALACATFAFIFRNRDYRQVSISRRETFETGKSFIKLGIYMTAGAFVTMLANYVFAAWLNQEAGTEMVGLYQAGNTLVNKYTALILAALGMEYYPRLARMADDARRLRQNVSQEIAVALTAVTPIAALFIVLRLPIISLLYSGEFHAVAGMVSWGAIGSVLRTLSWCIAFVILARGAGRIYLITESLSAVAYLALHIAGYRLWGLTGLGIAFMAWYAFYTVVVAVVMVRVFRIGLSGSIARYTAWAVAVTAGVMVLTDMGWPVAAGAVTAVSVAVASIVARRLWKTQEEDKEE